MPLIDRIAQAVSEAINAALGVTLTDMLVQLAATIILVIIVKKFFWGRITDFLEKRQEHMAKELSAAASTKAEAESLKEKTEADYNELRSRSKDIIDNARKNGESERAEIIKRARAEAQEALAHATREIESEKEKARDKMRLEAVDLAAAMAEKIIEQEIDRKRYEQLALEDIEGGSLR